MEDYLTPDPLWCITQTSLAPEETKHYEGLLTQGSGYLHLRGSYEEGLAAAPQDETYMRMPANVTVEVPRHPRSKAGTYLPGVTGQHPLLREEVVNLPNPLAMTVRCQGRTLDMDSGDIFEFSRTLDLRDGVLRRRFCWRLPLGELRCDFTRFVSQDRPGLIVQRMDFCASSPMTVTLDATVDETVTTNGYCHFRTTEPCAHGQAFGVTVTTDNGDTVTLMSRCQGAPAGVSANRGTLEFCCQAGVPVRIDRLTLVSCSRDPQPRDAQALATELETLCAAPDALYAPHAAVWQQLWEKSSVIIRGDDQAQFALNVSLYHLLRAANRNDSRVAVCAKGFAGEAYFGHFFWDTELYLLPFFLYTNPAIARSLTRFRIGTLDGARENAAAYGYPGAKYAWESSVTGAEQCPNWQYCDHEVHITADVAFGLWHDWKATGDRAFLEEMLPVLTETTRYWLARVQHHPDGTVHLNGVMGPDEYICMCNDSAYTNTMVRYALRVTREAGALLGKSLLTAKEQEQAAYVEEHLVIPRREDGMIWQCEAFDRYEDPDFTSLWPDRTKRFGAVVSQERNYRTKALKQADVLMLPYLFPDTMDARQLQQTYDYYYPLTTHDSSLSYIIHAIVKARMGDAEEAYSLFEKALAIDLDGGAAEGIHIANCGGIWQGVVMGFCGMDWCYCRDDLHFTPHLPAHWQEVSFRIVWHGAAHRIRVTHDGVSVEEDDQ